MKNLFKQFLRIAKSSVNTRIYVILLPSKFLSYRLALNFDTVIDVGCGTGSSLSFMRKLGLKSYAIGIDIHLMSLKIAKKARIYDDLIISLIPYLPLRNNIPSSVALCADVIEHLEKGQGLLLLDLLEKAVSRIIIITPRGFLYQVSTDNNPFQTHVSGWEVKEMKERGYKVYGCDGFLPRDLTGRPLFPWLISFESLFLHLLGLSLQFVLHYCPIFAFRILCVKDREDIISHNLSLTMEFKETTLHYSNS